MEHVTATDGETVDHRNDGFGKRADLLLHIKHIKAGYIVLAYVPTSTFVIHVTTCAKGHVAGASKQHNADVCILATMIERLAHFTYGEGGESVAITGAVDGNFGNAVIVFKDDFFEGENFFPHNTDSLDVTEKCVNCK